MPYLRGFGPTRFVDAATPRSGQQAALGADLLALLDALALPRAVLAGYDWGGRAACIVAALWPRRFAGLVSLDSYNIQNIARAHLPIAPAERDSACGTSTTSTPSAAAPASRRDRRALCRLLWQLWSPSWNFDDATFERSAAAFDNPDFVEVVVHSYRHRFALVAGDPACDEIEQPARANSRSRVPAITFDGADDGVMPAGGSAHACPPVHRPPSAPGGGRCRPRPAAGTARRVRRRGARTGDRDANMNSPIRVLSEHCCFGGVQGFYEHDAREIGLPMRFSVYLPPQAAAGRVPALLYLAGLTCNEETFAVKAGAQRIAAQLGLALISPDTSPRGAEVEALPGAAESWDFGIGAGFYLDATQAPWAGRWRMESWIVRELLPLAARHFELDDERTGIFGHSMGGHGALTLALRHPGRFRSLSALAPICAPSQCPWGRKAFDRYLGSDQAQWLAHDACALMRQRTAAPFPDGILIDQGLADKFLAEQLHPEVLEAACHAVGQPLELRRHAGYDHGYYFIQSMVEAHLRHHHTRLALDIQEIDPQRPSNLRDQLSNS